MEKYYTPHLDEFYQGFEYDFLHPEKGWITFQYGFIDDTDLLEKEVEIKLQEIRVKYLDTNDIISLGFDLIGEGKELKIFRRIINEKHNPIVCELRLNYEGDFPIISIFEGNDILINSITCYNKSELKWILNRLRII